MQVDSEEPSSFSEALGSEEPSSFSEALDNLSFHPLSPLPQDRASTIAGIREFAIQDTVPADFSMTSACNKGPRTNAEVMAMIRSVTNCETGFDELRKAVNTRMNRTLEVMKHFEVEKKLVRPIDRAGTVEAVKILEAKLTALLKGNGNAHLM